MCNCWSFCPICKTINKHNWDSKNTGWYKWHESEDPLYCEDYKEYLKNKIEKNWYVYSAEEIMKNETYKWWEIENYDAIFGKMMYLSKKYSYIRPNVYKSFQCGIIETKSLDALETVYDKYMPIFEAIIEAVEYAYDGFHD